MSQCQSDTLCTLSMEGVCTLLELPLAETCTLLVLAADQACMARGGEVTPVHSLTPESRHWSSSQARNLDKYKRSRPNSAGQDLGSKGTSN